MLIVSGKQDGRGGDLPALTVLGLSNPKETQIQAACSDVPCSEVPFPAEAVDFPDFPDMV